MEINIHRDDEVSQRHNGGQMVPEGSPVSGLPWSSFERCRAAAFSVLFDAISPVETPGVWLTAGVSGLGKTSLFQPLFSRADGVVLDADALAAIHPDFSRVLSCQGMEAARLATRDFALTLLEHAVNEAISRRLNFVVEGTLQFPGPACTYVKGFLAADYRVGIAGMTGRPGDALRRAFLRHLEKMETRRSEERAEKVIRGIQPYDYVGAVSGIADSLAELEALFARHGGQNRIVLCSPQGQVLYTSRPKRGAFSSARDCFLHESRRPPANAERFVIWREWRRINSLLGRYPRTLEEWRAIQGTNGESMLEIFLNLRRTQSACFGLVPPPVRDNTDSLCAELLHETGAPA